MALTKKDQEMIAQIAAQAAITAVQAMGAAPAAPVAQARPAVDLPDDAEDEAAARAEIEANEAKKRHMAEMVETLLPELMQPRHLEVFRWLGKARGVADGILLQQIVRAEVMKNLNAFRESRGMGGGSTNNKETIAELARLREENQ